MSQSARSSAIPILPVLKRRNPVLPLPKSTLRLRPALAKRRRTLTRFQPPRSYTVRERARRLVDALIDFDPANLLGEFRLSSRQPYLKGLGHLYFFNASEYWPDTERVFLFMSRLGGGSFFTITIHADAPGNRFLLDISVSGEPGLRLEQVTGGNAAVADARGHALMVVTAGSDKIAGISLHVQGDQLYVFHNVVVSPL